MAGVKSTALKFGDSSKTWLSVFSGVMVGGLCVTGVLCDQVWPYYLGTATVAAHLAHQVSLIYARIHVYHYILT